MKQIKCEICEGSNLVKQEGMFVCSDCGSQYSVEEVKKMMSEDEEVNKDAAYYLALAKEADNYADCMSNIEKALSLEPLNYDVLLYKFLWIVTTANLTNHHLEEAKEIEETILSVVTVDDSVCMKIYGYYRKHAVDIMLRTIKMLGNRPDVKIYNEVMNEYVAMTRKSLDMMRRGYTGVAIPQQKDYLEAAYNKFAKEAQVFELMFNFAFSIVNLIKWDSFKSPFSYAILALWNAEFASAYEKYSALYEKCLGTFKKSFTEEARRIRNNKILEFKNRSAEFIKIYEEDAKARREAIFKEFWEKNAAWKNQLEAEKNEISERILQLQQEVESITNKYADELNKLYSATENPVPAEEEATAIKDKIADLKSEMEKTNIFQFKLKKQLLAEIDEKEQELTGLSPEIEAQKKAVRREYNSLKFKVEDESRLQNQEIYERKTRIAQIDTELTKERTSEDLKADPNTISSQSISDAFDLSIPLDIMHGKYVEVCTNVLNSVNEMLNKVRQMTNNPNFGISQNELIEKNNNTFASYMAFIAGADGVIDDNEVDAFSQIIGKEISKDQLNEMSETASKQYLEDKKTPEIFDAIFSFAKISKRINFDLNSEIVKLYNLYRHIGRVMIMADGAADPTELAMYSTPIQIIAESAKRNGIELPYDDIAKA